MVGDDSCEQGGQLFIVQEALSSSDSCGLTHGTQYLVAGVLVDRQWQQQRECAFLLSVSVPASGTPAQVSGTLGVSVSYLVSFHKPFPLEPALVAYVFCNQEFFLILI